MKKKKVLLFVTVTSMIANTVAVLAICGGLKSSSAFATNGEVWHHYAAVAPTATTYGSKEFWASSTNGCTTHTFTNPGPGVTCIEHNFSTYDSFASLSRDDDRYVWCLNEQWGITPVITENTVTYGIYPQTVVDDSNLLTSLNALNDTYISSDNGWYFYENAYYAKISAAPFGLDCKFDNGTEIEEDITYWFKCEPISWTILTNDYVDADINHLGYYLLSDVILDSHCYYHGTAYRGDDPEWIYPNNYEYSDIRPWLNNEFYNPAFALHHSYIQTTTVDNSASTTSSSPNSYACDNTQDNVFLPSYKDYINSSYGFSTSTGSDNTRCCKTTDWARARGVFYNNWDESYLNNGVYWTRSPDPVDDVQAWYAESDGSLTPSDCYREYYGVRPSLSFMIV